MKHQQQITLAVCRWSAWAPGVTDAEAWLGWARGEKVIEGPVEPDVQFVPPLARRRLSRLSRMVFRTAADCLAGDASDIIETAGGSLSYVFCSRHGELHRSTGIISGIMKGEEVSAAAFSTTVHNTSASLFAIEEGDHSQSISVCGGETSLEAGFLEAWCQLSGNTASTVLLVYHDERLPEVYRGQHTTAKSSAAIAMLLQLPGPGRGVTDLHLSWRAQDEIPAACEPVSDPALQVLRLLINGGEPVVFNTERLVWTWSTGGEGS